MELRRFDNILAIKTDQGRYVGLHATNLEVAELSEELWNATIAKNQATEFLNDWNTEVGQAQPEKRSGSINALTINVTQICNLHCQYCAAGGDGTYGSPIKKISVEATIPQLKFFVDRLAPGETLKINFVGGEPLLYPEGIRLISEYLNQVTAKKGLKVKYKLVTNGTQFTDANIELIKSLKAYLVVSLDGPAEVNDLRRPSKGGQGVTAKVIEGLKKVATIESQLENFEISGVFGPGNLDLHQAYQFYVSLGARQFDFIFDHHDSHLETSQKFIAEYETLLADIFAKEGEAGIRKIVTIDSYFQTLDSQTRVENYCGAGKNFLVIDGKNQLFTCPWDSGNAAEMVGHHQNLDQSALAKYQKPLIEKSDCKTCWARYICGGGCMYVHKKSTGSKNKVDEMFCYRTRNLISLTILYYERARNSKELSHVEH